MSDHNRTFSDLWYRVADFRPRLSSHLAVRRHTYRNHTWFIIGDPASNKFYRFNASAYRFLGLLDGQRTVQEAWDVCNAQMGDDAPTQKDCLDLLAQLQMFGLLRNDLPVDPQRLRERFEKIREQKYQELTGKYVFWTLPIFNPERFLAKYAAPARVVFSRWGLLALGIMLIIALRLVIPRWEDLTGGLNAVIAPENLIWLTLAFLFLRVLHELAHGFACKAYGGRVTEIGIMLMIVLPIPYCDASSSWALPNKWHRILVSCAGMMVELFVACIAAIVWARTEPGLVHTLAYNVMFAASVATILFNLNPLLRYDGYYILADLAEIPNLATRSKELMKWLTRRYLFGLKGEPAPPLHDRSEGAIMVTHAILAFPYRLIIMFSIVLFVAQSYFVIGILLGMFGALMWLVTPIVKGYSYVLSEPTLQTVRVRATAVTFGATAALIGFLGFVPMPARVHAGGIVEPLERLPLRAPQSGFLRDVYVHNGATIRAGEPVLRLEDPAMSTHFDRAVAGLEAERLRRDAAAARSPTDLKLAEHLYVEAQQRYQAIREIIEEMSITAPFDAQVVVPDIEPRLGTYIDRGTLLGMLATLDDMVIRAYIDDRDFAWLFPGGVERGVQQVRVKGRIYDRPGQTLELEIDTARSDPVGSRALRHPSLGHSVRGGWIAVDPTDPEGQRALKPQWLVTLRVTGGLNALDESRLVNGTLPGTRARVRFSTEPEPLASQWYRRIRQAFAARFEI